MNFARTKYEEEVPTQKTVELERLRKENKKLREEVLKLREILFDWGIAYHG